MSSLVLLESLDGYKWDDVFLISDLDNFPTAKMKLVEHITEKAEISLAVIGRHDVLLTGIPILPQSSRADCQHAAL